VTGRVSITLAGYAVGTGQRSPDKGRHAGRGAQTPTRFERPRGRAHGWITMHPSGAYLMFTQAGVDLFA
jgi:hypothetical protein